MRCPTLAELPAPPPGKTGWPWTVESPQLPDVMPDGSLWPRISIVTPSYNQVDFLEETIRSVLLQGYPDLQYIVMDGDSTDGSVDILDRYSRWFSFFQSGPDGGQAAAIHTGFEKADGHIRAWINSDDGYLPESFAHVGALLSRRHKEVVFSDHFEKSCDQFKLYRTGPVRPIYVSMGGLLPQHTVFWTKDLDETVDAQFQCNLDYEFWIRLLPKARRILRAKKPLAFYNSHPEQKTQSGAWSQAWQDDARRVYEKHPHIFSKSNAARWLIQLLYKLDTIILRGMNRVLKLR